MAKPARVAKLDATEPRGLVDYALQRRSVLADLPKSMHVRDSNCDVDPYLKKAAKFHGEETTCDCPVCEQVRLVELQYVFGDELGPYSGRLKSTAELRVMAAEHGEFRVYVVEVCRECGWNFLVKSFQLGDGVPRRPLRKPKDWID
jgi:hypothetical protein